MRTTFFLFIISIFLTSCSLKKENLENKKPIDQTLTAIPKLIIEKELKEEKESSFELSNMNIDGDILSLTVSYGGGCKEHEFNLYFSGNYKKSLPPKAEFKLVHKYIEDPCRSIVEKTLKFNISGSKYEGQKEIVISINGFENTINYKY